MPEISLVRLSQSYPEAKEREKSAAWLLAFDSNQDGSLDASEVQGPGGYFRCDWLGDRMNVRRWRNLETILRDAGLVERRRPHVCGVLVERPADLPITPEGRYPAAHHILFFAKPFDRIFALSPEATVDKFLEILKSRSAAVKRSRNRVEVVLDSGAVIQFRLGRGASLQEIHYLDAAGGDSLLTRLDFLQIVRDAGAFEKLFSKNPYFAEEREAWLRLYSPVFTYAETQTLSLKEARGKKSWRQILLFPDLHGNKQRFCALYRLVSSQKLDWLAMEMFSQAMQPSLDDFLAQPESSEAFRAAKKKIQEHLAAFWNPYFKKIHDPDESPYYRLLLLCRKKGLRVVALDAKAYYSSASQKFAPLTIGTRNLLWAKAVPAKGRGIVFGGQAHFTANPKARVQDFLLERNSNRSIYLLNFSKKDD